MSTLPLSVGLHRFDLIAAESRALNEMLAVAEQKMVDADAELVIARLAADTAAAAASKAMSDLEALRELNTASPQDEAVIAAAQAAADAAVATAEKAKSEADAKAQEIQTSKDLIESLRKTMAQMDAAAAKRTLRPVYVLRVPNFRLQAQFEQSYYDVPMAPTDRKLWLAMKGVVEKRGAEFGVSADNADFQTLDKAFRDSGSAKVPAAVAGLFEDLFTQVAETDEVRKLLKQRKAHHSGMTMLRLRFYVAGLEGLPGSDIFTVEHGLASEDSIALIPPSDIDAILSKLDELTTTRGREGNS